MWGDRIPIGIFYEDNLPVYEKQLPALSDEPLVKQKFNIRRVEKLLAEFM
jgi:hypothetical protein